jgi:hypothetical protein
MKNRPAIQTDPTMPDPQPLLSPAQSLELIDILKARFAKNPRRHPGFVWAEVQARLEAQLETAPEKCWSLYQMEQTGGEPDVIGQDPATGAYLFCDCSAESPKGRRSLCYDPEALADRKDYPPAGSAVGLAASLGLELLTEAQYRELQQLGEFDTKTSSWIQTPPDVRKLGGALFADRRYGRVFVYHNGAPSYYAARGFRGLLRA